MKRLLFALFTSLALLVVSLPAAPPYYPIDQVKPGMVATGYTVWQGDKIEEFKVHIIGVLRNVIGPRRDLILAKLEGGPLAQTGVIAGMSGSPVYIDGKLVGAVSYSLGAFSKEPIAGITPIAEMIDAATLDTPRPPMGTRARLEMPVTRESVAAAMRASMSWARPFADRPGDVQIFGDGVSGQVATMLRPIATPLNLGGFSPDVAEMLGASFRDYGFLPVAGAAAAGTDVSATQRHAASSRRLRSASTSSAATSTWARPARSPKSIGNRVYAFGHPFFNLGPIAFPMTQAYVHTLLPSMTSSMKIATLGDVIGTVHQDRATTIAGLTGDGAGDDSREDLARIRTRIQEAVRVQGRQRSAVHAAVHLRLDSEHAHVVRARDRRGHVQHQGHDEREVARRDQDRGSVLRQQRVAERRRLGHGAAHVSARQRLRADSDRSRRPDDSVHRAAAYRDDRARLARRRARARRPHGAAQGADAHAIAAKKSCTRCRWRFPPNATGSLSVMVSDGVAAGAVGAARSAPADRAAQRAAADARARTPLRKNNRLYVRLLASDAGAVVRGEPLSSLPPSVLGVLEADRSTGDFVPLRNATLGEWNLPTEYAVVGSRVLTINIE